MSEELRGTVDYIVFSSSDETFCVMRLLTEDGKKATAAGEVGTPRVGQSVMLRGCWTRHPRFGMQFKAESMAFARPARSEDILRYLMSGEVEGIGPSMARRIVNRFGKDTLTLMDENIEALLDVPGIGKKTLEKIRKSYEEGAALRELTLRLQAADVPTRFAKILQKNYGARVMEVLEKEPYRMVREISGMGFAMADRLAMAAGVAREDRERILCGISYVLSEYAMDGHCCVPERFAYWRTAELLGLESELVSRAGWDAAEEGEIPSLVYRGERFLYIPPLYEAETESRVHVCRLMKANYLGSAKLSLEKFERRNHIELAPEQREAVERAMESGLLIITGGPGTGKTTLIRAIITAAEEYNLKIRLMAPTGRAAKRLSLSSGREAETIHKALEAERRGDRTLFNKDESDPLKEDLIIVDEASMVDMLLFYRLLSALKQGARLILVGDTDQLPPVGPGSPLKDLIAWGDIPVVRLSHIFRQAEGSGIIAAAAAIREGNLPTPDIHGEFRVLEVGSEDEAFEIVMRLCRDFRYEDDDEKGNLQVLSPMYKGACGVDRLNAAIQQYVQGLPEPMRGFAAHDKVMQSRNDYEKGVYNGDIGLVWAVNDGKIQVKFPEKEVTYEGEEKGDLRLAYATTVHKSQGSEYETVIFVLLPSQRIMLQRNLLYTGVTRAAKRTILITTKPALSAAVRNHRTEGRTSLFLPLLLGEVENNA